MIYRGGQIRVTASVIINRDRQVRVLASVKVILTEAGNLGCPPRLKFRIFVKFQNEGFYNVLKLIFNF
jgi:hypothetical protein